MDEHERSEVAEFWEVGEGDYYRVVRGESRPAQSESELIDLAYVEKVFAQSDDYIVYLSSEKRLRIVYDGSEPRGFAQVWAEAQHLQSLGKLSLTSTEEMDYFLSRIAAALSVAFEGEIGLGMEALRQVREYIRDRKDGESRRRYALMTMMTGIAAVTLGATVAGFASVGETAAGDRYAGLVGLALVGGGLGTFLATNNPQVLKKVIGPVPRGFSAYGFGITRTLLGVASAFVVLLAVRTGILQSSALGDPATTHGLLFVAIAAGLVEGWARNL